MATVGHRSRRGRAGVVASCCGHEDIQMTGGPDRAARSRNGPRAPAGPAQAAERVAGVCQYRARLLVLAPALETDMDGMTHLDGIALGTAPCDASSRPVAQDVLDLSELFG
jgi:hypothetical protein